MFQADEPTPTPNGSSKAGSIALLAIGLLILVPSGLCTGIFGVGTLVDALKPKAGEQIYFGLGTVLITGGPFVLIGGVMVWTAIKRLRRR